MKTMTQKQKDKKLEDLILYIVSVSENDEHMGAIKLNKVLFYVDFRSYLYYGTSVTGQQYQVLEQGPAPKRLIPVRDGMIKRGLIAMKKRDHFGYTQSRILPLDSPDLTRFTAQEIDLVNRVLSELKDKTAREVTEWSHKFPGWYLREVGDEIPYHLALCAPREPSAEEIAYACEVHAEVFGDNDKLARV